MLPKCKNLAFVLVNALLITIQNQSQALDGAIPTALSDQTNELGFWNKHNISNFETVNDDLLRILTEPKDVYSIISIKKNAQIDYLEKEALRVFLSRTKGKSSIEIERLYGSPFLKAGNNLGFNGVTSSQCLWLYYFGRYAHYPVSLIFDLSGKCQSSQRMSIADQDSLLLSKIKLVAVAKGKTKEEIYKLDPYPNSRSQSIKDASKTILRYYCESSWYFDLIFKDDVCVETDSVTRSVSERFVRRWTPEFRPLAK